MSTKIYQGFRFPDRYINQFIDAVDRIMFGRALRRVKMLMAAFSPAQAEEIATKFYGHQVPVIACEKHVNKVAAEQTKDSDRRIAFARFQTVINEAKRASAQAERDPAYNLDCGVNIWFHDHDAYGIPIGEGWLTGKLRLPWWVKNYSYWNNTDRPRGVTQGDWDARGKRWDKVCLDNWNARRLWHEVISFAAGHFIPSQVRFETALGFWKTKGK